MYIKTHQRLKAVLNSVDDAILMVDKNYKVLICNKRFEDFFGIKPSTIIDHDKREAITREIKWQVSDPDDFQDKLFWLYDNPEVISTDEVEVAIPRKRTLKRFSGPVYDDDATLLGRVEVYSDITHERNLQKELEEKNTQLYLINAASTSISQSLKLDNLTQTFIRRITQATRAKAGIIYVNTQNNALKLNSFVGKFKNSKNIPEILNEPSPSDAIWGYINNEPPLAFLADSMEKGFFVAFPGLNDNEGINSLCILIWDGMSEKWLHKQLFKNIGMQLGIGVRNAQNYESARRNAILQERDRIAMEMHDGLAQTLGYLGLGIDSLTKRLVDNKLDGCYELLCQLRRVIDNSYSDVREAIIGLRVDISQNLGFIQVLDNYIQEFSRLTNIKTFLKIKGECYSPNFEKQLHIIRIVQEALTNVRRHAQATVVNIIIFFAGPKIKIVIEDNGKGFDKNKNPEFIALHQGIKIMKTRATSLRGHLDIQTTEGTGTKVILIFPSNSKGELQCKN